MLFLVEKIDALIEFAMNPRFKLLAAVEYKLDAAAPVVTAGV
jgi:hypothetical protein